MRLHVTHDDKFLDYFIANAECAGYEDNHYVIYNSTKSLIHTKSDKVKVANLYSNDFYLYIGDIRQYDSIYIHFFTRALIDFVLSIPVELPVVWVFWGGDGFEHPKLLRKFLKPLTLKYYNNYSIGSSKIRNWINLLRTLLDNDRKWSQAVRRFDYFCHYIEEDWQLLRGVFKIKAKLIDFNYGGWYQLANDCPISDTPTGINICLGNSGDITNNHLDALDSLHGKLSCKQKIFTPLSYAAHSQEYIDTVIHKGHEYFGEDFIPLTTFLSKHEYDEILKSCNNIIMPHIRSQAFANIQFAIAHGKKVFMSCESSLYKLLHGMGFKIYSIEQDLHLRYALLTPISPNDVKTNLLLLDKHYGFDKMMARYRATMQLC